MSHPNNKFRRQNELFHLSRKVAPLSTRSSATMEIVWLFAEIAVLVVVAVIGVPLSIWLGIGHDWTMAVVALALAGVMHVAERYQKSGRRR